MNVSKKTLAVIYWAATWQKWNGSFALNEDIADAIERIAHRKYLSKFYLAYFEDIQDELQKIGKPNKRNKRVKKP